MLTFRPEKASSPSLSLPQYRNHAIVSKEGFTIVQIKLGQEKPVRENERRVRVGTNFKDAVKEMSKAPPMTNEDVSKWVKKQREETDNLENDRPVQVSPGYRS